MHSKFTTNIEINKVRIGFTKKKMTAYGGFSLLALFFERINLREILQEAIPIQTDYYCEFQPVLAFVSFSRDDICAIIFYMGTENAVYELFGNNS